MSTSTRIKRLSGGLGAVVLVLILGYSVIRPFHLRAGATDAEVARSMPGDPEAISAVWTRAVTIEATPEQIWPWLVQFGQGRGGWYSYDWLENLLGFDIHTADRILPEYQSPAIGEPICLKSDFCSNVSIVEPGRFFGWQSKLPNGSIAWNFIMGLYPIDATHTRLVVREGFGQGGLPDAALRVFEIPDVVMELKMLHTIKDRAEGYVEPGFITGLEIMLWIAALIPGGVAGFLMLTRQEWKRPLGLGLVSVIVLLVLSFLFLPLWLRATLDIGLWIGLVWMLKQSHATKPALKITTSPQH